MPDFLKPEYRNSQLVLQKLRKKKDKKIHEFPAVEKMCDPHQENKRKHIHRYSNRGTLFLHSISMIAPQNYNKQGWMYKRKEGIIIIVIATVIFILYFTLKDRPAGAPPQEQKDSVVNKDTTRVTS